MALIEHIPFKSPLWQFNGHLQTIAPSLFRKPEGLNARRERILTADEDFLDLDWHEQGSSKLLILSHGLEGDSSRQYILGMVKAFKLAGYDCLAWNYRGCSGEINKQLRYYHSGATDDLEEVIQHALQQNKYEEIVLIGFSLGGNLTLKYLGEKGANHPAEITKAMAFSVPLNLSASCRHISRPSNMIYSRRFLNTLLQKAQAKHQLMSDKIDIERLKTIRTLHEFDDVVTGPIHGFQDAEDYYSQCSSIYFIENIRVPTLVVNALNDPFLPHACYPKHVFKDHRKVHFETPPNGGHCGFETQKTSNDLYWSEQRAVEYVTEKKMSFA
jgi:uncharacterized protein